MTVVIMYIAIMFFLMDNFFRIFTADHPALVKYCCGIEALESKFILKAHSQGKLRMKIKHENGTTINSTLSLILLTTDELILSHNYNFF